MNRAGQARGIFGTALNYAALIVVAGLFLLPLAWMLSVSLKPTPEVFETSLLPRQPTLDAYAAVIGIGADAGVVQAGARGTVERVESGTFNYLLYARNT